jgi:hypothetical protein
MVVHLASLAFLTALALGAQPTPPGPPLACGGAVTILLNGVPLSSGCVLNLTAGFGVIVTAAANTGIGGTDLSFSYNSALIPTHDTIHANENYCESTNGTTGYTCQLPDKTLTVYSRGQLFLIVVDATCVTNCTLNINTVGRTSIKRADGTTDPGGLLIAGQARLIWYDGTVFRLI